MNIYAHAQGFMGVLWGKEFLESGTIGNRLLQEPGVLIKHINYRLQIVGYGNGLSCMGLINVE